MKYKNHIDLIQAIQPTLKETVANVGWGPKEGFVQFYRFQNGWILGNGMIVSPWCNSSKRVPWDPKEALTDILNELNELRSDCNLPLISNPFS